MSKLTDSICQVWSLEFELDFGFDFVLGFGFKFHLGGFDACGWGMWRLEGAYEKRLRLNDYCRLICLVMGLSLNLVPSSVFVELWGIWPL